MPDELVMHMDTTRNLSDMRRFGLDIWTRQLVNIVCCPVNVPPSARQRLAVREDSLR